MAASDESIRNHTGESQSDSGHGARVTSGGMNAAKPRRGYLLGRWLVLVVCAGAASSGRAADPVPYAVTIQPTQEVALDQAIHDSALLLQLRDTAPVGPFALVFRARDDAARFTTALRSFGYYDGTATVTIDGHRLDDPALPDLLAASLANPPAQVAVKIVPGPQFKLRKITVTGDVAPGTIAALGLKAGDPARAADVQAARDRLLAALLRDGHALARVQPPVATLYASDKVLDVTFAATPGPVVDLGAITITGLERMNESFVRRRLLLKPGEQFNPARIERAREDLASLGVFATVRMMTPDVLGPDGRLPMHIEVTERKLRAVELGAGFSTDQGGHLSASWTHRNLFGNAEKLVLSAQATELGGSTSLQPGYDLSAQLTFPDWLARDQSLAFNLEAVKQDLEAYNRTAALASVIVSRRLSRYLSISAGLVGEEAHIVQNEIGRDYTLLQTPLTVSYNTARPLLDPVDGFRAAIIATPTISFATSNNPDTLPFMILQGSASTYVDLGSLLGGTPARSVLATRGLVGSTIGTSSYLNIPPDQRFYAGGGGTIRGYQYQSVGPKFSSGHPTGGTSIDVGSIELRQRIVGDWGTAIFVDAGQVGTNNVPFTGTLAVGAGAGVRYYSPIGPIRVDFALPLVHEPKSGAFELYIGIGQAF